MPHDSAPVLPENCPNIINFWQSKHVSFNRKHLENKGEMNCSGATISFGHITPEQEISGSVHESEMFRNDYNLRWLLRWIALFWVSILQLFTGIFGLPNREIGMQAA
jgi:hypothetical protein